MTIVLILLLLLFLGAGGTYSQWGANGPTWGGNVLYLLAIIVLIFALLPYFNHVTL